MKNRRLHPLRPKTVTLKLLKCKACGRNWAGLYPKKKAPPVCPECYRLHNSNEPTFE